jgi:hypothetical protein
MREEQRRHDLAQRRVSACVQPNLRVRATRKRVTGARQARLDVGDDGLALGGTPVCD